MNDASKIAIYALTEMYGSHADEVIRYEEMSANQAAEINAKMDVIQWVYVRGVEDCHA